MLPLAALAPPSPFSTSWIWNDFITHWSICRPRQVHTVPLGILFLNSRYTVNWGCKWPGGGGDHPTAIVCAFKSNFSGIMAGAIKMGCASSSRFRMRIGC
jgi:hypothetical protein